MKIAYLPVCLLLISAPCSGGSIGLYVRQDGTGCRLGLSDGESATVYAIGITDSTDPFSGGIDSGEFRIVGLPSGWMASSVPDPAVSIAVGDPFADGVVFAWPSLQGGVIPLFSITLQAHSQVDNVELQVVQHVSPSPPFGFPTDCPWFHYPCGGPCDNSGTCVQGVSLFVNGECTVGVEAATWSAVRLLYESR